MSTPLDTNHQVVTDQKVVHPEQTNRSNTETAPTLMMPEVGATPVESNKKEYGGSYFDKLADGNISIPCTIEAKRYGLKPNNLGAGEAQEHIDRIEQTRAGLVKALSKFGKVAEHTENPIKQALYQGDMEDLSKAPRAPHSITEIAKLLADPKVFKEIANKHPDILEELSIKAQNIGILSSRVFESPITRNKLHAVIGQTSEWIKDLKHQQYLTENRCAAEESEFVGTKNQEFVESMEQNNYGKIKRRFYD